MAVTIGSVTEGNANAEEIKNNSPDSELYENNKKYLQGSLVKFNDKIYLAKRNVPSDVDLDNPYYWEIFMDAADSNRVDELFEKTGNLDELETESKDNLVAAINEVGSIQPDWNQNDETKKDYIKNRPGGYYKEITEPTLIIYATKQDGINKLINVEVIEDNFRYGYEDSINVGIECSPSEIIQRTLTKRWIPEYVIGADSKEIYGNAHLIDASRPDTGEDIAIYKERSGPASSLYGVGWHVWAPSLPSGDLGLVILEETMHAVPFASKFIPWEASPTATSVLYTAQSLTDEQKVQARANIGAGTPYTLPQATAEALGGVKADSAEAADTQPVRIGGDGKLYTAAGGTDISTKMDANNPVGTGSFSMNRKAGTEIGVNSHAEGNNTTASGYISHAEGNNTTASGYISHAEGNNTTASGYGSHAEGYMTVASGNHSHVQGKHNIKDSSSIYADIIGNGTSDTACSNAATVDWNGNAWFAGDVYTGSNSGTNKDDGSKKLATKEYVDSLIAAGGTDISLGLTSAAVGQIIKVKAIDESGKPTEWESADMPSGGGSEWVKVADVTYNSNKEVVVESIDYESGVFTSTNHGLQNGDNVYFVPNSVYEYSPEKYMPGGTLSGTEYKVTNATENTFALNGVTITENPDIDFSKWHLETNENYGSSVFISNLKLMNDVKVISYGKTVSFLNYSTCAAEVNNVLSTAGAYEGKLPNNHFYDGFGDIGYEIFIGNILGCCETVITRLDKTHIRSEITALFSNSKKSSDWGINSSISRAVVIAECLESAKHPTKLEYWNFYPANGYRIEVYTK